jgi:very-short-patch-repair endonuclease
MTNIEIQIERILVKLKIPYEWNSYVKTKTTYRFPDFKIENKKLIIECDGEYWHRDKEKDLKRQQELEEIGYKVIRFSGKKIRNNIQEVEQCLRQKLKA